MSRAFLFHFATVAERGRSGGQYQNLGSTKAHLRTHRLWQFRFVNIMVYYFTSATVSPAGFIYVGKDKVESENIASLSSN